jgi:hypothetical protein
MKQPVGVDDTNEGEGAVVLPGTGGRGISEGVSAGSSVVCLSSSLSSLCRTIAVGGAQQGSGVGGCVSRYISLMGLCGTLSSGVSEGVSDWDTQKAQEPDWMARYHDSSIDQLARQMASSGTGLRDPTVHKHLRDIVHMSYKVQDLEWQEALLTVKRRKTQLLAEIARTSDRQPTPAVGACPDQFLDILWK